MNKTILLRCCAYASVRSGTMMATRSACCHIRLIQNAVHHRYSKLLSENTSLRQLRFSFPDLSESVPNFIVSILGFIPGLAPNFPEFRCIRWPGN